MPNHNAADAANRLNMHRLPDGSAGAPTNGTWRAVDCTGADCCGCGTPVDGLACLSDTRECGELVYCVRCAIREADRTARGARARRRRRRVTRAQAYRFHRAQGVDPAAALACARAEQWAYYTTAEATDLDDTDPDTGEPVSRVLAGFGDAALDLSGTAGFHRHAPSVLTFGHCYCDTGRRFWHAVALADLRHLADTTIGRFHGRG